MASFIRRHLRRFGRRPEAGLPDLINYAALVDHGVVLLKDGAFLTGWRLRGPDLESADASELESLAARTHHVLRSRGNGYEYQFQAVRSAARRYARVVGLPDATTALIDEERQAQHAARDQHFETDTYFTLTYLPPPDVEKRAVGFFIENPVQSVQDATYVLERFHSTCEQIHDQLETVFELHRLDSVELLSLLKRCVTGISQMMRVPVPPMYLDYHLAGVGLRHGFTPMVGDHHVRVVAITDFPGESSPAMLDALSHLPLEYRWSIRFMPLDLPTAEGRLRVLQRQWFQKRKGVAGLIREAAGDDPGPEDADADHMALDATAALALASEGEVRFGYFTSVVVLFDEDRVRVEEGARDVLKQIHALGFTGRIETVNAVEAYLGSLPGHGFRNVRRPIMHTLNLADLVPTTSVWTGERRGRGA